jgi:hypothetical protein
MTLGAIAVGEVAGTGEAGQLLGPGVKERARLGPLVAAGRPRRGPGAPPARDPVATQHLPDGGAPAAHQAGQARRAEVGAPTGLEDTRLLGRSELPGAGAGPGRAALKARPACRSASAASW